MSMITYYSTAEVPYVDWCKKIVKIVEKSQQVTKVISQKAASSPIIGVRLLHTSCHQSRPTVHSAHGGRVYINHERTYDRFNRFYSAPHLPNAQTDTQTDKPVVDLVRAPPLSNFRAPPFLKLRPKSKFCVDPICRQPRTPLYQNFRKNRLRTVGEEASGHAKCFFSYSS